MTAVAKRLDPEPDPEPLAPQPPAPAEVRAPRGAEARAAETSRPERKKRRRGLMLIVPLALAVAGGYVWLTGGRYATTDNAYVSQPLVNVSSDLPGRIVAVDVAENQKVARGAPIFRLDAAPFRTALDQADAALASARLNVGQLRAAYAQAKAKLAAAEHIEDISKREYYRQKSLAGRGVATSAALDAASMAISTAASNVTLARQGVDSAAAALGGDPAIETDAFPAVRAALAQRDAAARDLAKTQVVAPVAGVVSQVASLTVGRYVTPGTPVASLVQIDDTWVEANYKETQLEFLRPGQDVEIRIDAYPGLKLHGTVDSIGSATGAQFALIPPQNATGNWVKVVQRVPVRIAVHPGAGHPLRDGMSAEVSVDTGKTRLERMGWLDRMR